MYSRGVTACPVTAITVTRCDGRDNTDVRYPPIWSAAGLRTGFLRRAPNGTLCRYKAAGEPALPFSPCSAACSGPSAPGSGRPGTRTCRCRLRRKSRQRQRPIPGRGRHVHRSGFQVPGRIRHIGEQLGEGRPDAVLAALDAGRGDEDSIVGVVGDDGTRRLAGCERIHPSGGRGGL